MTFRGEFTPEAEADLDRLFDFLLDRAETVEEAMRAYEAVKAIRNAANGYLATTTYSYRRVGQRWSSSSVHAINAKRIFIDGGALGSRRSWMSVSG